MIFSSKINATSKYDPDSSTPMAWGHVVVAAPRLRLKSLAKNPKKCKKHLGIPNLFNEPDAKQIFCECY